MTWRIWILAVVLVTAVTGATYSVYAFTFTGARWPNGKAPTC